MFIKEKNEENTYVEFVVSPVYDSKELVKRCRLIVDDYFTFINYERLLETYNFRKYCLEPVKGDKYNNLIGITISGLKFRDRDFNVLVMKKGSIIVDYPKELIDSEIESFISYFERMINYAL